jgi:hypothetical protein
MSQESDFQWKIDRVWAAVDGLRARFDMWPPWSQSVDGRLTSAECGRAKHGKRLSDVEQRIEALEAAERTGCPSGYSTVNGGPLRQCLETLMKRYEIGKPKTATQVDQAMNEMMAATPPTCGTCRWFNRGYTPDIQVARVGGCRRYPATAHPSNHRGQFPVVEDDMWCGEHSPR